MDHTREILLYLKQVKPRGSGHKVVSQDAFLDGAVATVKYRDEGNEVEQYVIVTKGFSGYAGTQSQLIQQMHAAADKRSPSVDWLTRTFSAAGLIALLLVLTVSYLTVSGKPIPDSLSATLTTIVGFYFGGSMHRMVRPKRDLNTP